jgi:hypothetical protein
MLSNFHKGLLIYFKISVLVKSDLLCVCFDGDPCCDQGFCKKPFACSDSPTKSFGQHSPFAERRKTTDADMPDLIKLLVIHTFNQVTHTDIGDGFAAQAAGFELFRAFCDDRDTLLHFDESSFLPRIKIPLLMSAWTTGGSKNIGST